MIDIEIQVAELFHENTKVLPYENGDDPASLPEPLEPSVVLARYRLPQVAPVTADSIEQTICQRTTARAFNPGVSLPLELLSRLLAFSGGYTIPFPLENFPQMEYRRASPSAGATYPIEIYPIVHNVASLPQGVYRYSIINHTLELIRAGDFRNHLNKWTLHQPYIADASVVFVMAGFSERIYPRYGERGYRYMLLEAGHIAQNIYLLSTAYGLGALANGGFVDTAINRLLGLNELTEIALYLSAVGILESHS